MLRAAIARWVFGRTGGMRHRMLSWPLALAILLANLGAAAWFLPRLAVNNSPEVYYPRESPAVALRDRLRADFPNDEVLTILFSGDDLYAPDRLQELGRLEAAIARIPLVDRVTTVLSFERIVGTRDGFSVEPLVKLDAARGTSPVEVRNRVLADRFAPGLLASRDGRHLAMAIRPKPLSQSADRLALKVAVASAINASPWRQYFAGDAGPVSLDVAQLLSVLDDSAAFVPLTVAIGLALMAWVVGRFRPVVIGGLAMAAVVAPVVGGIAASGQPYTMATAILPSLLAAYTTATLLHLYAGVQRAYGATTDRDAVLDEAIGETRKPSAYNVLTTGAGLLSLTLVPIPPVQVFGIAGAAGTALVFVTVYFLVPPLLRRWDRGPWPVRRSTMGTMGRLARQTAVWSASNPWKVMLTLALLVAAFAPVIQRVSVQTDFLAFFAPTHTINVHTRRVEDKLSGVTTLELSLRGAADDTFQDVEVLGRMAELQQWLERLPEVDRTVSMADLVQEMHRAMSGAKPPPGALPQNNRLLRQYLLIYDGNDLYELVDRGFRHARIVLNLNVHGTREIRRVIDAIQEHVRGTPIAGVQTDVGGYGRLLADQVDLLVTGQTQSFAGAFGLIFAMMLLQWRRLGAAVVVLIPNVAPLFFVFVLMGAVGIPLDLATVMIASVVLGITIDDTIHLFHAFNERRRDGVPVLQAIAHGFEASGRAVIATSVVLIAQFLILAASDFKPTADFGLMTAVGLATGLAFEILLLPPLLVLRARASGEALPGPRELALAPAVDHAVGPDGHSAPAQPATLPPLSLPAGEQLLLVCLGPKCRRAGATAQWRALREASATSSLAGERRRRPVKSGCLGHCDRGAPVACVVSPDAAYVVTGREALSRLCLEADPE